MPINDEHGFLPPTITRGSKELRGQTEKLIRELQNAVTRLRADLDFALTTRPEIVTGVASTSTGIAVGTTATTLLQVTLAIPAHWVSYRVTGWWQLRMADSSGGTGVSNVITVQPVGQSGNMNEAQVWEFSSDNDRDNDSRGGVAYLPNETSIGGNRTYTLQALRSAAPTVDADDIVWVVHAERLT